MSTELTRLHRLVRALSQELALIEEKLAEHLHDEEPQQRAET
jgi:hypothetical protein